MKKNELVEELIGFIKNSPTPFHATKNLAELLKKEGFVQLEEKNYWEKPSFKSFVVRGESSIFAYDIHPDCPVQEGIHFTGAHTDSPCFKIKPNPEVRTKNYLSLGVEVYGGVLLSTWFDRDLSIAGRVHWKNQKDEIESSIIDFKRPIALIPNLAIHLNRESNKNRTINPQKEIYPILLQEEEGEKTTIEDILTKQIEFECGGRVNTILDFDLSLYDTQIPEVTGYNNSFLSSARLDNLLSCFINLKSFLSPSNEKVHRGFIAYDHEEVGSASASGAMSDLIQSTLRRIIKDESSYLQTIANSIFLSVDNAHALHPNYQDKHDDQHQPIINNGPVIKRNANQRYATNSETSALFIDCCLKTNTPFQKFVVRNDMGCGSTIGPITATNIGIKTLDIGVPTYAMHSIREMAGVKDISYLKNVVTEFYNSKLRLL